MPLSHFPPLASVEAARPVFMIVMGVFLAIIAWRLAKTSGVWTARILVSGAFLLCLGYAAIVPAYEAGLIHHYNPRHQLGNPATALAWKAVKLAVMNGGWLVFGLGIASHAGLIRLPSFGISPARSTPKPAASPNLSPQPSPHESIA